MANNHDTHGAGGAAHGSTKEYVTGLILSLVLTAIPFALVMMGNLSTGITAGVILVCAIAQLFVQVVFFLHMNGSSEQEWNTITGAFSILTVVILVIGSIWVISHLNHNMLMGH